MARHDETIILQIREPINAQFAAGEVQLTSPSRPSPKLFFSEGW